MTLEFDPKEVRDLKDLGSSPFMLEHEKGIRFFEARGRPPDHAIIDLLDFLLRHERTRSEVLEVAYFLRVKLQCHSRSFNGRRP